MSMGVLPHTHPREYLIDGSVPTSSMGICDQE